MAVLEVTSGISLQRVRVRLMQPGELDAVVGVWQAARTARRGAPSPERVARVREKLEDDSAIIHVASGEAAVIGMVAAEPGRLHDGAGAVLPDLLHISMLFVAPEHQRQGVGRRLLLQAFDSASAAGMRTAALWTATDNRAARLLYESVCMTATRTRQVSDTVSWVRYARAIR